MKNRIKRFFKSRKEKIGLPPGTLKFIGEKTNESTIEYVQFNASTHNIEQVNSINDITINNNNDVVNWIKISGLNVDIVEQLGKKFNFHNLMLEDILNTDQRPKIDDFKDYIYFVLKKHRYLDDSLSSQQISFILTPTFVITIEEDNSGLFNPILERIKNNQGYICTSKSDYLLYALIDVAIDNYFTLIEKLDEKIENLEHAKTK
jgi:magnesium transporter